MLFFNPVQLVDCWMLNRLHRAGGPANDNAINGRGGAEPVVDAPLALRAETGGRGHFLRLHFAVPM